MFLKLKELFMSIFQSRNPVQGTNSAGQQSPVSPSTAATTTTVPDRRIEEVQEVPVAPQATGKKFLILREADRRQQTLGTFTFTDGTNTVFTCKTIELPWLNNQRMISCIPDGTYKTTRHNSPKYGVCFWLQDVPGRSEILIHHGNYAASINPSTGTPDTRGCILVGERHADVNSDGIPDVTSSVPTMRRLREILPNEFQLEVRTKN
jgi:hypothetical protein